MTTVWITKYALTVGIQSGELIKEEEGHATVSSKTGFNGWEMFHGLDWHYDLAGAKRQANDMRKRKIASAQKQIARLDLLTFDTVTSIEPR
jgi:hypothetical protein